MTPQERGALGGLTTAQRYGSDHMREIGRKGGDSNLATNGRLALVKANHMKHGKMPRGTTKTQKPAAANSGLKTPEGDN